MFCTGSNLGIKWESICSLLPMGIWFLSLHHCLTKLLIPSETASVLCLGPVRSNTHLSALSFPSQEFLFLDCFSIYLWWSQMLHLNLYELWWHMLLCSSAAVAWNLSSVSVLLICNPLVITALMEKLMRTLLIFLFLAWVLFHRSWISWPAVDECLP